MNRGRKRLKKETKERDWRKRLEEEMRTQEKSDFHFHWNNRHIFFHPLFVLQSNCNHFHHHQEEIQEDEPIRPDDHDVDHVAASLLLWGQVSSFCPDGEDQGLNLGSLRIPKRTSCHGNSRRTSSCLWWSCFWK